MTPKHTPTQIPFIRELCKNDSEEIIREAEENFLRYIALVKRICERIQRENAEKNIIDNSS